MHGGHHEMDHSCRSPRANRNPNGREEAERPGIPRAITTARDRRMQERSATAFGAIGAYPHQRDLQAVLYTKALRKIFAWPPSVDAFLLASSCIFLWCAVANCVIVRATPVVCVSLSLVESCALAWLARCARSYRAHRFAHLGKGPWRPRCIPRQGVSSGTNLVPPPRPRTVFAGSSRAGFSTRYPTRKEPSPLPSGHPLDRGFTPGPHRCFEQRLRPGGRLPLSLPGPPIDRGFMPPPRLIRPFVILG